jgi:hypothetical protein
LIAGKGVNSGVSSKYCIGLAGSLIEMEKNDISHSISRCHRYVRHSWQDDVLVSCQHGDDIENYRGTTIARIPPTISEIANTP